MWLLLNGERREVANTLSLAQLVEALELPPERIAIELNQSVVRRTDWSTRMLKESDRVEIVHFVGGGADNCGTVESGPWGASPYTNCHRLIHTGLQPGDTSASIAANRFNGLRVHYETA